MTYVLRYVSCKLYGNNLLLNFYLLKPFLSYRIQRKLKIPVSDIVCYINIKTMDIEFALYSRLDKESNRFGAIILGGPPFNITLSILYNAACFARRSPLLIKYYFLNYITNWILRLLTHAKPCNILIFLSSIILTN